MGKKGEEKKNKSILQGIKVESPNACDKAPGREGWRVGLERKA